MARILIIDDSDIARDILRKQLEDGGYTVVGEAGDGIEGLDKFKELQPDITTLDITMPEQDGIETLKMIMEIDPNSKVIMVSSSAQNSKIVEALMLGAVDFLAKPFESQNVLESIANLADELDIDSL